MVNGGRAGYLGMGCEDRGGQNILPYIIDLLGPSGKYENMPGNSQGILREKMYQSMENLFVPSRTVLWCTNGVVRAAISIPHL